MKDKMLLEDQSDTVTLAACWYDTNTYKRYDMYSDTHMHAANLAHGGSYLCSSLIGPILPVTPDP